MDRLVAMEAFVRVVEAGSFTDAARGWGRSKAAVSGYLADLEAHLGVQLLQRSTRAMSLTEAGRRYYASSVALLAELDAAELSLREGHARPTGRLRVTAPPGFAESHPRLITTEFIDRYPEVTLELELTHRLVDLVAEGFDVAIRITDPTDSSLVARRIAAAPLVAVASPGYLARHGGPSTPEDLRSHACLIDTNFRDGNRWRFRIDGELRYIEVDGPYRVNNPAFIRDLAEQGRGIAMVPLLLARQALEEGRLVSLLDGMPAFDWSIYAVYPRRRYLSGRVRAFIDHLAERLPTEA